MQLDLVLPVYNEAGNLRPLRREIDGVMASAGHDARILFVDDGSEDDSPGILDGMAGDHPHVAVIHFADNCGQSAAFAAGFAAAKAPVVVTMDSDGQNDPADVPDLLDALGDCDVAAGYRANRRDTWLRKLGSRLANGVRNWVTGDDIIDTGCSLKAFRLEVVRSLPMFRGMHRFLPTLARMQGYRVRQVPTHHRPRRQGETKYTLSGRLWTTIWDLWAVRWMQSRALDYEITSRRNL